LIDLIHKDKKKYRLAQIPYLVTLATFLTSDEILDVIEHYLSIHNNVSEFENFRQLVESGEHQCPSTQHPFKTSYPFKAMVMWAKNGRTCCIIKTIESNNNSEIYLKELLPLLTQENLSYILNQCDIRGTNVLRILIHFPNLLRQHCQFIGCTIDSGNMEWIIYDDKLDNYIQLLQIAREINFRYTPSKIIPLKLLNFRVLSSEQWKLYMGKLFPFLNNNTGTPL
jgi:hypothetical protein